METIIDITEFSGKKGNWGTEAGYIIKTSKQDIKLAIDDDSSCCESWGYFITEDATEKFIGAELQGVTITDTNRIGRKFITGYTSDYNPEDIHLDEGDTMFVDIETDRGVLQFAAYNAHNGYYGHEARVSSEQLTASKYL